jgi:hypothetical protein
MCTPEAFMEHVDYVLMNTVMKECITSPPPPDTGVLFFRQNTFNRTLSLPHYQNKTKSSKQGKCFPATAPHGSSIHRTVFASRPLAADDVKLPSKQALLDNYTRKIDKKFLRKD